MDKKHILMNTVTVCVRFVELYFTAIYGRLTNNSDHYRNCSLVHDSIVKI